MESTRVSHLKVVVDIAGFRYGVDGKMSSRDTTRQVPTGPMKTYHIQLSIFFTLVEKAEQPITHRTPLTMQHASE